MVLSSGVVLWRKGFSPWDTSPASSTSSFYRHHIQMCHIHLCEATLGFSGRKALVQVCDQGEMLGAPRGSREGALPCHPPQASPHPPDLEPRVLSKALYDGKRAGSHNACDTEGLRIGGAVWEWEEAGGIPREHPMLRTAQGCLKEKPQISWLGTYLAGGMQLTCDHPMQIFGKCSCICFACKELCHT